MIIYIATETNNNDWMVKAYNVTVSENGHTEANSENLIASATLSNERQVALWILMIQEGEKII